MDRYSFIYTWKVSIFFIYLILFFLFFYIFIYRTDVQCREKWSNILDPTLCKNEYTKEEDDKLKLLINILGTKNWSLISSYMPGRTDYSIRKRWNKIKK